jgi:hypothetical protein
LNGVGEEVDLPAGLLGFVAYVPTDALDMITIAFPKKGPLPDSLEKLARSAPHAVRINWPTFRANFEVDV